VPSVVPEVSVSSHRPLHNGKRASGSSQGRDQATPFEAMLDSTTPESTPKKAPKADKPDKAERPAPSRRANETDSNSSDPACASGETDTAPEATAADGTETQAATEAEAAAPTVDSETDAPQTAKTDDAAADLAILAVLTVVVEPAAQPVAAPVIAAAITITAPPVTAEAPAGTELTGVVPTSDVVSPDAAKAAPQAAPVETAAPDQVPEDIKPQIAQASAEKASAEKASTEKGSTEKVSAEKATADKPAANKAQAQPAMDDGAATPKDHDIAGAEKKAAPPVAPADAKPDAPAKPKIDPDAMRNELDLSPREHAAKAATDSTQNATLNAQTQTVHSAAASTNEPQQAATAVPVAGLAVEIAAQARAGKNRFEIRLDPPELGRIDVRLDVDKEGNVTSRLIVERSDTLDLLRRDAHALERALNQAGLKTADNALEFSLRDQGFANNDNNRQNARDGAQLIIPDEDSPVLDAARGYGRLLGLGNGLDISV
jgi:flagellar hook-length control protein FliK